METVKIQSKLNRLAKKIIKNADKHEFNLLDLPDLTFLDVSIRKESPLKAFFEELDKKTEDCLYWFEVDDIQMGNRLQTLLNEKRSHLKEIGRKVPIESKYVGSNVLYVGVRHGGFTIKYNLSNLSARIREHLGYYKVGSAQGLQLAHWARNVDCKVTLKVVEFDNLPKEYLTTIEKIVAYKLKPLCGIH